MTDHRRHPNVLLIVVDGLRADHVSSFGYARPTTPVLDRLARDGVRATQAFAAAPTTLAAHASLFTGLYPVSHGATSEHHLLSPAVPTLAGLAKAAGYRTAAFCTHPQVSVETGLGRGFDAFHTQRYRYRLATRAARFSRRTADRLLRRSDAGARRTVNAMRRWFAAAPRPFFAFAHFDDTRLSSALPPLYSHMFATAPAGDAERQRVDLYDSAIRYVDERIGDVLDSLASAGELERTLVLVTADHGVHLGDGGRVGHGDDLHRDVLRVPLIAHCPALVPQGFVIDTLVQAVDVAPTILSLAGVPYDPSRLHGQAFLHDGRAVPTRPFAIAERYRGDGVARSACRSKAIWTANEKFVWHSDEANEYYDLRRDPAEQNNRIETDAGAADALRRQLFDFYAGVNMFEAPPAHDVVARAV